MEYILVLALCVLSTAKMTVQGFFGRKNVVTMADSVYFNGAIFIFSALIFANKVVGCSDEIWIYGAMFGAFSVIFQLSYTKALSIGNVALTVMISNLSIIFPIIFCAIVYGEPLSFYRIIGIILTFAALIIVTDIKRADRREKGWLLFAVLSFCTNAGGTVVQKIFGKSEFSGEGQAFVACAYICAAVMTVVVYMIISISGHTKSFPTSPKVFIYAAAVGLLLAAFQAVNTYTAAHVDGTFHYPVFSGAMMIFSTLSGVIIFRDKLSKRQLIGIATAIVAVVMTNF